MTPAMMTSISRRALTQAPRLENSLGRFPTFAPRPYDDKVAPIAVLRGGAMNGEVRP